MTALFLRRRTSFRRSSSAVCGHSLQVRGSLAGNAEADIRIAWELDLLPYPVGHCRDMSCGPLREHHLYPLSVRGKKRFRCLKVVSGAEMNRGLREQSFATRSTPCSADRSAARSLRSRIRCCNEGNDALAAHPCAPAPELRPVWRTQSWFGASASISRARSPSARWMSFWRLAS